MLRSDLIFMTKQGLTQLEEILSSRTLNLYRNKKLPKTEPLAAEQYLGFYNPKSRQDPEWTNIIKPTLEMADELADKKVHLVTPAARKLAKDLKASGLEQ